MRNILGMPEIQSRGQVPDNIVPQAHQFFTNALGVRIGSADHMDQLAVSPQAYYNWMGAGGADVPPANVARAHRILRTLGYPENGSDGRRNKKWDLTIFENEPFIYPMVGYEVGKMLTSVNPINKVAIEQGYPVNQAPVLTDGNGNPLPPQPTPPSNKMGTILLVVAAAGAAYLILKPKRGRA